MTDKGGRPTEYDSEKHPRQALVACKRGGFSQRQLAELFDVDEKTIRNWLGRFPEFKDAVEDGKKLHKVEAAFFKRAVGIRYTETVTETLIGVTEIGEQSFARVVKEKKTKKFIPPDVRAGEVWMTNRDPERWKSRQNIEMTGANGGPVIMQISTGVERGPGERD
ncbi:hypothetical protein GO013_07330 [Pseudodesulfovibrio sp. JC047]|uniref:hypothetical protein n=1 Tax=Pseudodesulfovibrio sp. JC047 TaxID=2683199 RepID=UPI0013D18C3A|nr:hypothetical protein [Pseudodesulfovibrio sp. JC047]NDV19230.1 hypothetical protein [Pseudodesulfovibrio sp. JC047]